jgi:hypothetical protein
VLDARGGEQRRRGGDVVGVVARGVDGDVPDAALEGREVGRAVADEMLGLAREQVVAVPPAVEDRHVVAARQRLGRHVAPEEDRPAEDEEPHDAQRISCVSAGGASGRAAERRALSSRRPTP